MYFSDKHSSRVLVDHNSDLPYTFTSEFLRLAVLFKTDDVAFIKMMPFAVAISAKSDILGGAFGTPMA